MLQLLQSREKFICLSYEDLKVHLQNILEISDTFIPTRVSTNYVRLTLFPFSLLGKSTKWLYVEPSNSIITWDDLANKFLILYIPSDKASRLHCEILNFKQKPNVDFYHAQDMFKSLVKYFLHLQQMNEVLFHNLVLALDHSTKILIDSSIVSQDFENTYDELYNILN